MAGRARRRSGRWRRHIHATPSWAVRSSPPRSTSRRFWRGRAQPEGAARRDRADLRPRPGPSAEDRAARGHGRVADAERTGAPYASTMPNAAHACGHDAHTAILVGAAFALAAAPELPVGVRLVFQPAEELMPGGAIDTIAAGVMSGVAESSRCTAIPGWTSARSRSKWGRSRRPPTDRDHPEFAGRTYVAATSDRRPGVRLGTLITGLPGVLSRRIDPRNSTVMVWGAVNAGVARQRDSAERHAGRHDPHRQPRDLAGHGGHRPGDGDGVTGAAGNRAHPAVQPRRAAGGQRRGLDAHPHPRDRGDRPGCAGRHQTIRWR